MELKTIINFLISTKPNKELFEKWKMNPAALYNFKTTFYGKNKYSYDYLAKKAKAFGYKVVREEQWGMDTNDMTYSSPTGLYPKNRLEFIKDFAIEHSIEIYKLDNNFCCYIDYYDGCKPYSQEKDGYTALIKGIENYLIKNT